VNEFSLSVLSFFFLYPSHPEPVFAGSSLQMKIVLLLLSSIVVLIASFYNKSLLHFIQAQPKYFTTYNNISSAMSTPRTIRKVFLAVDTAEGAGARVRRSIGTSALRNFSPFLMLDHFTINPGAGFPDHPHRGQETITYLLKGAVDHEDFAGNAGTIEAGDLQFMTAGKGIMHAEMPRLNEDGSSNVGLQLWVDLPEKLKACEPRYRDLRAAEIPNIDVDDNKVHIKIISGQSHGVDSVKELSYTPVWMLDIEVKPGGKVTQSIPEGWNAFIYTLEGTAKFGAPGNQTTVEKFHNVVLNQEGNTISAEVDADAKETSRFGKTSFPTALEYTAVADFSNSTHRWNSFRSKGCAVRSICFKLTRWSDASNDGFPESLEWLRTGEGLAEQDWAVYDALKVITLYA
jgi:redox-sensitive bicupin YhaK (pirin superfamily)